MARVIAEGSFSATASTTTSSEKMAGVLEATERSPTIIEAIIVDLTNFLAHGVRDANVKVGPRRADMTTLKSEKYTGGIDADLVWTGRLTVTERTYIQVNINSLDGTARTVVWRVTGHHRGSL